jgi:hypothetical protein
MITSALLRTETERWREEYTISRPARSYRWVLGQAWHDNPHQIVNLECSLGKPSITFLTKSAADTELGVFIPPWPLARCPFDGKPVKGQECFNMQYLITLRRQNARVGNLRLHYNSGLCVMSSGYQASKRGVHDSTSYRGKITRTALF